MDRLKRKLYLSLQKYQDSFIGGSLVLGQGAGIMRYLKADFRRSMFWRLRRTGYYLFSKSIQDSYDRMKSEQSLVCMPLIKKGKYEEAGEERRRLKNMFLENKI